MTYRLTTLSIAFALSALGSACDLGSRDCAAIAVASVSLQVIDAETKQAIAMPAVTFTVDSDPEVRQPVESYDGLIVLTYEEVGRFEVEVAAEGYAMATETYVVELDADGCHPDGVNETVELTPTED